MNHLLSLLSLTMISTDMLVSGGICYNPKLSRESNLRTARRKLQYLRAAGYIKYYKYPVFSKGFFRRFYYLSETGAQKIGVQNQPYHIIHEGLVEHDSITALFLTHLFRCCHQISLLWYPPFDIADKQSDGAVFLIRNGKTIKTLVLESDTGTQSHRLIREKIEAYLPYTRNKSYQVVFLTQSIERMKNLQTMVSGDSIMFCCPYLIPPEANIFQILRKSRES